MEGRHTQTWTIIHGPADLPEDTSEWCFWPGNEYLVRRLDDHRYVSVCKFMFTTAILVSEMTDAYGYSERWCYHHFEDALIQATVWDGTGEPEGWHRHIPSGRYRTDGDAEQEYRPDEWVEPFT